MRGDLQRAYGRGVRVLRQRRGLSQERFGQAVGLDRTYIGSIERGERNLTLGTLEDLSVRFDADPLDLITAGMRITLDDGGGATDRSVDP